MNGIILINKEPNMTSNDVLYKIKKAIPCKKIGHAGTLDPIATGLLVIMLDDATKLSNYLLNDEKEYIAEIVLGVSTDTEDREGKIITTCPVTKIDAIDEILSSLVGELEQVPPMYSAIKINGKKLYELARKGKVVERESRIIHVLKCERISEVLYFDNKAKFSFKCQVSKGTYIRSLCFEIGRRLNLPAHMSELQRTRSGSFQLENANTLKDIENHNYKIVEMIEALSDYPMMEVNLELKKKILNGVTIDSNEITSNHEMIVFKEANKILAIYKLKEGKYRAERVWN